MRVLPVGGRPAVGTVGFSGDHEDWYHVESEKGGTVTIELANTAPLPSAGSTVGPVEIRDGGDQVLFRGSYVNPRTSGTLLRRELGAGEPLYVRITALEQSGLLHRAPYRLTARWTSR